MPSHHWSFQPLPKQGPFFQVAVSLLVLGALAAIMSTADSVLLSLSSILVQDFYAKTTRKTVTDKKLLRLGKRTSWILIILLVLIALRPHFTLWDLLVMKFELLIQVAPAFILGLYRPQLTARVALFGITVGTTIAIIGFMMEQAKWFGIHPGVVGCLINFAICYVGSLGLKADTSK